MRSIAVLNVRIAPPHGASITFAVNDSLKLYFKTNEFRVEYSTELVDLPYGIVVIPFVCNVLPIVWLTDAVLELDELDEDFYNSIADFKRGYEEMYPNLQFKGKIECKRIVKHQPLCNENRSLVFFSGGVDAFATLLAHIDENPTLFSICGADIKLNNKAGWSVVMKQIDEVSKTFNLPAIQCYSNFREFVDEEKLSHIVEYCKQHVSQIKLRVCWHSDRGDNCCKCEKCYRTIFGLIAEGANPQEYGLKVNAKDLLKLRTEIWLRKVLHKKRKMLPPDGHSIPFWTEIKERYIENRTNISLRWRISSQWFLKYV